MKVYDGFWNGEPAKFSVVHIVIGPEPEHQRMAAEKALLPDRKRFLWFVPLIGQICQAVHLTQGGQDFYMFNGDGTALEKVTHGLGSPRFGHRSVYPEKVIDSVEPAHWIKYSKHLCIQLDNQVDEGWMKIDPEGYPKHKEESRRLFEEIMKMQNGKSIFE